MESPTKRSHATPSGGAAPDAPGVRLDGWKAIAGHLGRDIRTVQRWEQSEGLPVRRLEHKQRASAYAFTTELDAWLAGRTSDERRGDAPPLNEPVSDAAAEAAVTGARRWPVALVAAGLIVAVVLGLSAVRDRAAPVGSVGDTHDPDAYAAFAEGRALYLSRQYADAAAALERAVSRDAGYAVAWAWLAKSYGRLAQPVWAGGTRAQDRATEAAARATRLAPQSADAHIAQALAARARGDVKAVRAAAQRASELDPRAAEALALLGDSYSAVVYACHADQDPALAESYYRKSMELAPNLTTTASNRAGNLRRMGRYGECVELLNGVMRAYRDETPLQAVRGACRLLMGDIAGATDDIAPLRNNPRIAPAGSLVYLGMLGLKAGRRDDGIRDLEAFTQYDRSARTELIVAEAYGAVGEVDLAAAHLARAFELDKACPSMVATSLAFAPIRQAQPIAALLAQHGIH